MKKILTSLILLLAVNLQAQTITVDGIPVLVSSDTSFPFWLQSGSSISPEPPVSTISILEFNIVSNPNGNDMVFNQVLSVSSVATVPEGKTWKVESVLIENQGFVNSDISNTNEIQNAEYIANAESGLHIKFYEPYYVSELSSVLLYADIQPGGGGSPQHGGFCYSTTNSSPDLNDDCIFDQNVAIGSQFYNSLNVGFDLIPDSLYYVRAFVSNNSGVTFSNTFQFETYPYFIGMQHEGGIIYYIDSTNYGGYIIAEENTPSYSIQCNQNSSLSTSEYFKMGMSNTENLRENCGSGIFEFIDNSYAGFNDWFIPSNGDLYYVCNVINYDNGLNYNLNYGYLGQDIKVEVNGIEYYIKRPSTGQIVFFNSWVNTSSIQSGNNFYNRHMASNSCSESTGNYIYPIRLIREF